MVALSLLIVALLFPPAEPTDPDAPHEGAVLLRNGHVLTGTISHEGEHTIVQSGGATIRLRPEDIAFLGAALSEIYEHQRGRRDLTSAADCLALAQWCVRNDLLDEAERELADARRAEADHPLLIRVERQIEARRISLARAAQPPSDPQLPHAADDLDRFARGMRGEAVEQFSSQIQPLLLNHCATAGCHAPRATQGFRLAAGGSSRPSRRLTLRNLQAVLAQVDRQSPADSPLLKHALAAHGSLAAPVFTDADSFAYQRLSAWIRQLGNRGAAPPADPSLAPARDHLLGQAAEPQPAAGRVVPASATAPIEAPVTRFPEGDPFDPAEFNRAQP